MCLLRPRGQRCLLRARFRINSPVSGSDGDLDSLPNGTGLTLPGTVFATLSSSRTGVRCGARMRMSERSKPRSGEDGRTRDRLRGSLSFLPGMRE